MINAAVVGVGYWGPNLLRNLVENEKIRVKWICDLNTRSIDKMTRRYPGVEGTTRFADIINDTNIDLVVIATPVQNHSQLAIEAMKAGKHVLVTKPMAQTEAQCLEMIETAEKTGRLLMVDHTFVYHPAVRQIAEMMDRNALGSLLYFQSTRMNLGIYQPDVSVIFDLMAHDLSILNQITKDDPVEACVAAKHAAGFPQPDIAYLQLNYNSGFIASIQASWLSPYKVRQTIITGSKKMILYDDNDVTEKVRVFDKGVDSADFTDKEANYTKFIQYRQGDVHSPALPVTEALKIEIEHLVDCIEHHKPEDRRSGGVTRGAHFGTRR
jgi:predicted dehydrogenase